MPILPMVSRTVDGVVVESQDERQENILIFKNNIAVFKKVPSNFLIFSTYLSIFVLQKYAILIFFFENRECQPENGQAVF